MNSRRLVGMLMVAMILSIVSYTPLAQGQVAYPVKAGKYSVWFARAMDDCVPANTITVVNPGAINACAQANSTTDSSIKMSFARLQVKPAKKGASVKLTGSGFQPAAARIGLQMTLRTTNTAGSPSGSKTYEDETVICGGVTGGTCGHYFAVASNGTIAAGKQQLADCVTKNGFNATLATGNIQIVDVALIDCDTGKVIATPGIKQ